MLIKGDRIVMLPQVIISSYNKQIEERKSLITDQSVKYSIAFGF